MSSNHQDDGAGVVVPFGGTRKLTSARPPPPPESVFAWWTEADALAWLARIVTSDPRTKLTALLRAVSLVAHEPRRRKPPKPVPASMFIDPAIQLMPGGFIGRPATPVRPMEVLAGPVVFLAEAVRSLTEPAPAKQGVQRIDYRAQDEVVTKKARRLMREQGLTESAALNAVAPEVRWGSQQNLAKLQRLRRSLRKG